MGYWELSRPERPNNVVLVPVQRVLLALHGVEGVGVSIVTIVASHPCDVACERREGSTDEGMSISSDDLLDHADVVLVDMIMTQQGRLLEVFEEPDMEVFGERLEEALVLLVSSDVQ